jgi:hypothetical protein
VLLAYVDGELPKDEAARVAEALRRDPEAAEIARHFREAARLLEEAYAQPMREPAPQRLRDAIDRAASVEPTATALDGPVEARRRGRRKIRFAGPLAAAVALTAGLAGGLGIGLALAPTAPAPPIAGGLAAAPQFQRALESAASGMPVAWTPDGAGSAEVMPVLTFRDGRGRFCREYQVVLEIGAATEMMSGIACRGEGGVWRPRLVMTAMSREPVANGGEFLPASGSEPAAHFRTILDEVVGERGLSPEAERSLLETGWQTE